MFYSDVKNSSITENFIHNGSGNGIVVDWYLKKNEYEEGYCQNITIESNLVSNIGSDINWTGHLFGQANWYAFGRLAWNPDLSSRQIAEEWLKMTFSTDPEFVAAAAEMIL